MGHSAQMLEATIVDTNINVPRILVDVKYIEAPMNLCYARSLLVK